MQGELVKEGGEGGIFILAEISGPSARGTPDVLNIS